jgi:hypothetical protein
VAGEATRQHSHHLFPIINVLVMLRLRVGFDLPGPLVATDGGKGARLRATGARATERPCAMRMGRKCFLWVTLSLHKQRKVTRSRQRAKRQAEWKASVGFSFAGA